MRLPRNGSILAALVLVAAPAAASDGVIEISQARAEAGAVTGSLGDDPPGFPVRITQSGSYRLTSDLAVPNVQLGGISIAAAVSYVTIDLGGFTIRGVAGVTVNPPAWTCTGGGNGFDGAGILGEQDPGANSRYVTIRNGRIQGMGSHGIDLGITRGVRVERVDADRNCGSGIQVGNDAVIVSSRARANRFNGILCANRCQIRESAGEENGASGVIAYTQSLVQRVLARGNGDWGIVAEPHSLVEASVSNANGAAGATERAGIRVARDGFVTTSIANRNQGYGIAATNDTGLALTVQSENQLPQASGLSVACNFVQSVVVCPP